MSRLPVLALLMALALGPSVVAAQSAGGIATTEERLTALFADFGPDRQIRIVTPVFFVEDASVEAVGSGFVELRQGQTTVPIDFADIRAVSVRSNHQIQGAIWGGAAGVLVGGVAGMMVASFGCTTVNDCNTLERDGAIRWATVFGVGGAVGGFVIGRYSLHWQPVFP